MTHDTTSPPHAGDWLTTRAVAECLNVTRRTVERLVADGTLKAHKPFGARGEKPPRMFWGPDVERIMRDRSRSKDQQE